MTNGYGLKFCKFSFWNDFSELEVCFCFRFPRTKTSLTNNHRTVEKPGNYFYAQFYNNALRILKFINRCKGKLTKPRIQYFLTFSLFISSVFVRFVMLHIFNEWSKEIDDRSKKLDVNYRPVNHNFLTEAKPTELDIALITPPPRWTWWWPECPRPPCAPRWAGRGRPCTGPAPCPWPRYRGISAGSALAG